MKLTAFPAVFSATFSFRQTALAAALVANLGLAAPAWAEHPLDAATFHALTEKLAKLPANQQLKLA